MVIHAYSSYHRHHNQDEDCDHCHHPDHVSYCTHAIVVVDLAPDDLRVMSEDSGSTVLQNVVAELLGVDSEDHPCDLVK